MQPDGERDVRHRQPMERIGARAGIIAPVGQHVIVFPGARRPGPGFGQDVGGLGERLEAVLRGTGEDRPGVAPRGRIAPEQRFYPTSHTVENAQMVHAIARELVRSEQRERVFPERWIERRDGEHVDLDARVDERAHVALEEGRDLSRIAAREDGEFHGVSSRTTWPGRGAVAPHAHATESVNQRIFPAIHVPLMDPMNVTAMGDSGRMPYGPRRARQASRQQSRYPMRNGIVPRMPVDDMRSRTRLWASRRSFFSSPMRAAISNWFPIGPHPTTGRSRIMPTTAG